ncbi:MAG: hypothetical protein Q9190_007133, partial [Brigantiaea leucoxantha]
MPSKSGSKTASIVTASDANNQFFKDWSWPAKPLSGSYSRDKTRRTSSSGSISPKTLVYNSRLDRRSLVKSVESYDNQQKLQTSQQNPANPTTQATHVTSKVAKDPEFKADRQRSHKSLTSKASAASTIIAKRTLKLVRLRAWYKSSPTEKPAKQKTKIKVQKKKTSSGHWLEVRIGRVLSPKLQRRTASGECSATPASSKSRAKSRCSLPSTNGNDNVSASAPSARLSTVGWFKRVIGLKRNVSDFAGSTLQPGPTVRTSKTPNQTPSLLPNLKEIPQPTQPGNSASRFASPWLLLEDSIEPASGPILKLQNGYIGSGGQKYPRVDLGNPSGPSFLPSEAIPFPIPATPEDYRRLQGFYFDYKDTKFNLVSRTRSQIFGHTHTLPNPKQAQKTPSSLTSLEPEAQSRRSPGRTSPRKINLGSLSPRKLSPSKTSLGNRSPVTETETEERENKYKNIIKDRSTMKKYWTDEIEAS